MFSTNKKMDEVLEFDDCKSMIKRINPKQVMMINIGDDMHQVD